MLAVRSAPWYQIPTLPGKDPTNRLKSPPLRDHHCLCWCPQHACRAPCESPDPGVGKTGLPLDARPGSSALSSDVMGSAFDSVLRSGPDFAYRPGVDERWELQAAEDTWRLPSAVTLSSPTASG
jgi:hypothetical protein